MTYRQQQEMEEERERLCLEILDRVAKGTSGQADALFLAGELGLTQLYRTSHETLRTHHQQILEERRLPAA